LIRVDSMGKGTACPASAVQAKWQRARDHPDTSLTSSQTPYPTETLAELSLQNLLDINASLAKYNAAFMGPEHFDFFVHLDTDDLQNVYRWRIDQEHALLRQRGEGMTDEGVVSFVKGYMPGYELYLGRLRGESFPEKKGAHLRVTLGRERNVVSVETVN
jgi:D-glycerate 3-kinase